MKIDIYNQIVGYLNGIDELLSYYDAGTGYSYKYSFKAYSYENDIYEAIESFYNDPETDLKRHEVVILNIHQIEDWEIGIFKRISYWFTSLNLSDYEVTIEFPGGEKMLQRDSFEYNNVVRRFTTLLKELLKDISFKVFYLDVFPESSSEFRWETIIFDYGKGAYFLYFYQQG